MSAKRWDPCSRCWGYGYVFEPTDTQGRGKTAQCESCHGKGRIYEGES